MITVNSIHVALSEENEIYQKPRSQDYFDEPLTGYEMGLTEKPIYDLGELLEEVQDMLEERRAIEELKFYF